MSVADQRQVRAVVIVGVAAAAMVLTACADGSPRDDDGAAPPTYDGAEAELVELLAAELDPDGPGVVSFVGDADERFRAAYGSGDLVTGVPIRVDDRFRIASSSKPMVAAAALTFVDSGELDLDQPLAAYLPVEHTAGLANADRATVRHALQMTSGIPDYLGTDAFWSAVDHDPDRFWTPTEALAFAEELPAEHAPGMGFDYSNSNYLLAQLVIEELAGQPLSEVLRLRVFDPAGMAGCTLETATSFPATTVRGYDLDDGGELVDVTVVNDGVGLGDGGIVCTVEDMVRFLPALLEGELLDDTTLAEMLDPLPADGGAYGLGIDVDEDGGYGLIVGHEGGSSGFQSVLWYLPDHGVSVGVLTNTLGSEVHRDIADELLAFWFADH